MNGQRIKKVGVWLLALSLFAAHIVFRTAAHAAEPNNDKEWSQVVPRAGECTISFPANPEVSRQRLPIGSGKTLDYDVYVAPVEKEGVCLLLIAHYPMQLAKGQERAGLEGLLRGLVGHNPENKLLFAKMFQLQGKLAIDFMIESGDHIFRGQALMVGNKLYLIAYEGRGQTFQEAGFQKFATSFKLNADL